MSGARKQAESGRSANPGYAAADGQPHTPARDRSGMVEMVLSHPTERSILLGPNVADYVPFSVGGRRRRATCSGVAWFRGYHLAVVNLYGCHLRIYRFHPGDGADHASARLELLHETSEGIDFPEKVAVAPDGTRLAVAHSQSEAFGISAFSIDAQSRVPAARREVIRPGGNPTRAFHSACFSPDSRHLAFTEISEPGYVEVVNVASPAREQTCFIANRLAPLKPKSVAFSHDGQFAAIAMGYNGTPNHRSLPSGGMLMVHRFDPVSGVVASQPLAELRGEGLSLATSDMCTFLPTAADEPYRIIVVDQAADSIPAYEFDPTKQTLVAAGVFADGLSFPHDVDVTADGKFAAIANYGDDSVRIARIMPSA
jgi:DNA-binding beta-propeller fold protein YncE